MNKVTPIDVFIKTMTPSVPDIKLPDLDQIKQWELENRRIISLYGTVNDEECGGFSTTEVCTEIMRYNQQDKDIPPEERKPIVMLIDSTGGDAFGTYALVRLMKISKTPIYTVNMCISMSAAGYVLAAGHKRFAMPGSTALVHSGSYSVGGAKETADSAKKMGDKIDERILEFLLANTNITKKDYHKYAPKDWYIFDEDQVKYGLVDKIVTDIDEIFE